MSDQSVLENKLDALTAKRDRLFIQVESLEADITVIQRAIKLISSPKRKDSKYFITSANEIRGMELEEALVYIAEQHNNKINTYHVRPVLIDAGILKGETGQTSRYLNTTLIKSVRFERNGDKGQRGHWGLAVSD